MYYARPVLSDPSVMRCAVCHEALDPAGDMALMTFVARRAGDVRPTEYRVYACGSPHAAEAMRRTAAAVEQLTFSMPTPGSMDWPRQHGVIVGAKD